MTSFPIQPSFARGELSPRLRSRVDIDYYRSGLAKCFNFYVMRQGGLRRRPGLRYINQSKLNNTTVVRPFVFSVDQTYAIEFGNLYLRFHTSAGTVLSGSVPYEIVSPWGAPDVAQLQFDQTNDEIRVTHKKYPPFTIRRYGELDWRILPIIFADGPYQDIIKDGTILHPSSNGGIIQGVVSDTTTGLGTASASSHQSSYPAWQAFDGNGNTEWMAADGTSSGEVLLFAFTTAKVVTGYVLGSSPREESYSETTGDSTVVYKIPGSLRAPRGWVFEAKNPALGEPDWTTLDQQAAITGWGEGERRYFTFNNVKAFTHYQIRITDINQSSSLLRPVAIGTLKFSTGLADIGLVTFTVNSIASINKGLGFQPGDVGRLVRFFSEDAYWHWFRIIAWVSSVQVDAEMYSPPLPSTNGTVTFQLGSFGDVPGWPARVGSYGGRIIYARTNEQPQTVWASRVDDYDSFTTTIPAQPDDALSLTFSAAGEVEWVLEGDAILVGTPTATRSLGPAATSNAFSATNFKQNTPLKTGSYEAVPQRVGVAALFVGRLGTTLHELTFDFSVNSYVSPDVAVLSEHLLRVGVKEIAYAFQPNAVLWMVMQDGSLVSMTYERDQKMVGLASHALGGGGLAESVCVVPGADRDEVWFTVNRGGVRTIEVMEADFEGGDQPDAFYVDCGVTYSGTAVTTVSNLPAVLRNKTVAVLADGAPEPPAYVSPSGTMVLPTGQAASTIQIGFGYQSMATTLRPPGQSGAAINSKKILKKICVDVLEAGDLKLLSSKSDGAPQEAILRSTDDFMDQAVPLFTGVVECRVEDRWKNGGQVNMIVDDPLPCTILSITPGYEGEP